MLGGGDPRHPHPGRGGPGALGGGRVVNVAARLALEPRLGSGMVAYTTAKAAVAALTRAIAQEIAGEEIWVNAVAPSVLDTAGQPGGSDARMPVSPAAARTPSAVAEVITFLASPDNLGDPRRGHPGFMAGLDAGSSPRRGGEPILLWHFLRRRQSSSGQSLAGAVMALVAAGRIVLTLASSLCLYAAATLALVVLLVATRRPGLLREADLG